MSVTVALLQRCVDIHLHLCLFGIELASSGSGQSSGHVRDSSEGRSEAVPRDSICKVFTLTAT